MSIVFDDTKENTNDTGCHLEPKCLSCRRPVCFYDEESKRIHAKKERRTIDGAVKKLYEDGLSPDTIASKLKLNVVTVYRHLRQVKRRPNKKQQVYAKYMAGISYQDAARELGIGLNYTRALYSKFRTGRF